MQDRRWPSLLVEREPHVGGHVLRYAERWDDHVVLSRDDRRDLTLLAGNLTDDRALAIERGEHHGPDLGDIVHGCCEDLLDRDLQHDAALGHTTLHWAGYSTGSQVPEHRPRRMLRRRIVSVNGRTRACSAPLLREYLHLHRAQIHPDRARRSVGHGAVELMDFETGLRLDGSGRRGGLVVQHAKPLAVVVDEEIHDDVAFETGL